MKTFQKIILASAISAAPFASQAMEALDDSVLAATTGQAGVTIEIDLGDKGIKVGSVVYTDTAHQVVDTNGVLPGATGYIETTEDGGSVALENINVNLTGTLVQTIDVSKNGDLEMTVTSPGALTITMGNDADDTTGLYSALKLVGANAPALTGNDSEIINNLDLSVNLGASTTTIRNLGTSGSAGLGLLSVAGVTGTYGDAKSSMAIEMTASFEVTDMNLGLFGYTNAQASIIGDNKASEYAAAYAAVDAPANTATAAQKLTQKAGLAAAYGDTGNDGLLDGSDLTDLKNTVATGSAIQISGVTIEAKDGGAISLNQVIWAVGGDATKAGSTAGVYIQLGAMDMNIGVADIAIGGSSIGSLAINGLELGGLTQRIYGH